MSEVYYLEGGPIPLMITKDEEGHLVLDQHKKRLHMGPESSIWLLTALKKDAYGIQQLERDSVVYLTVQNESGYTILRGQNSHFVFNREGLQMLIEILDIIM